MKILLTNEFKRSAKKLHRQLIPELERVIETIKINSLIGELKKGDLANVRVYKFHLSKQLILISCLYTTIESEHTITLISFGSHKNFYTKLKR